MPWLPAGGYVQLLAPGAIIIPGGQVMATQPPEPFATWPAGHMPWLPAGGYVQLLAPGASIIPGGHAVMTQPPEPFAT